MTTRDSLKQHLRRGIAIGLSVIGTRSQHDADGLLDGLEDPGIDFRLVPLGRAIDDPNVITGPAQVIAHLLKSRPVQEAGYGNEAHYAGVVRGVMVIDFPRGPTPEVDIQVAQVLTVDSGTPFAWWHPVRQRRRLLGILVSAFNPTAAPLGFLFIRRVPDHDRDWLFSLDLVRFFAGLDAGRAGGRGNGHRAHHADGATS